MSNHISLKDYEETNISSVYKKDQNTELLKSKVTSAFKLGKINANESLQAFDDIEHLEKGKRAQIGETREWGGKKYQKQSDKSWKPVKGGGKNVSSKDEKKSDSGESSDEGLDQSLRDKYNDLDAEEDTLMRKLPKIGTPDDKRLEVIREEKKKIFQDIYNRHYQGRELGEIEEFVKNLNAEDLSTVTDRGFFQELSNIVSDDDPLITPFSIFKVGRYERDKREKERPRSTEGEMSKEEIKSHLNDAKELDRGFKDLREKAKEFFKQSPYIDEEGRFNTDSIKGDKTFLRKLYRFPGDITIERLQKVFDKVGNGELKERADSLKDQKNELMESLDNLSEQQRHDIKVEDDNFWRKHRNYKAEISPMRLKKTFEFLSNS